MKNYKNVTYLSLGSNLGDKKSVILKAIEKLEKLGFIRAVAPFYQTEPWGFDSENYFINTAIILWTDENPLELYQKIHAIEKSFGEKINSRESGYHSRIIDIDILYYNDEIIETPTLQIPHPRLHERKFVLQPLLDIAPDFIHPILKKDTKTLYEECMDNGVVLRID